MTSVELVAAHLVTGRCGAEEPYETIADRDSKVRINSTIQRTYLSHSGLRP